MAAAAPVTVTRTVTLDPLAPAATEPAPAPNGATVIYVTRTREPTPTPTPEVCSAFVCPSDCDDWACFEASFGANGTPGEDGCPSFVQCIDYRCSHGESFSYDLARTLSGHQEELRDCKLTFPSSDRLL